MDGTLLGSTLVPLLALVVIFAFVVSRIDGLALFAPKSTKGIAGSATAFCTGRCRMAEGRCPLTGSSERAQNCPLWRFVDEDVPTSLYGSPFEAL